MYTYEIEKPWLFTDEGQRSFLKVRDEANKLCDLAGAVDVQHLMIGSGDSWQMLACVDRLAEIGEFEYIYKGTVTQRNVLHKVKG